MQRRRFKQSAPLDQRLTQEAERLRKEAGQTHSPSPTGGDRLSHAGMAFLSRPTAAKVVAMTMGYCAYVMGDDGHVRNRIDEVLHGSSSGFEFAYFRQSYRLGPCKHRTGPECRDLHRWPRGNEWMIFDAQRLTGRRSTAARTICKPAKLERERRSWQVA
jgi:hypothetical protein